MDGDIISSVRGKDYSCEAAGGIPMIRIVARRIQFLLLEFQERNTTYVTDDAPSLQVLYVLVLGLCCAHRLGSSVLEFVMRFNWGCALVFSQCLYCIDIRTRLLLRMIPARRRSI